MIFSSLSKLRSAPHIPTLLPYPPVSLLHTPLPPPPRKAKPSCNPARTSPLAHPLLSLLEGCRTLDQLKQIQAQMVLSGLISDGFASSRLVAFCAISDSPNLAHCTMILSSLESPNVFSWNVAIRGYSHSDDPKESILLYRKMLASDARPDNHTFPFLFKACARLPGNRMGAGILGHALHLGLISDVFVLNTAIHMLVMCGGLDDGRKLFDGSSVRDLVSWNTMINGYVQRGQPGQALRIFEEMEVGRIRPDEVTMIGVVSSCTQLQDLDLGRKIHRYIEDNGIELTIPLTNTLMDMYVKCGSLEPARALFDGITKRTVVSWTTMIVGYSKFGLLDAARRVFNEMPERDVVPWNALIAGYVQCRRAKEAIALFHEMQASHVELNEVTMVSLLSACSQLGALEMGMWIHHYIDKHKLCFSVTLGTALVDMYAKCGNIERSVRVFREIPERNALTWTAVICGLANHGHARDAISHFLKMIEIRLQPDAVTFIGVLSACCHAGLVDEGRMFFSQMSSKYKLSPRLKHYSCMVDLLGRAGLLHEAEELVKTMPMEPDAVVWGALFFACRIHGNVAMGQSAASRLLELDPHDSGIYVLLANMYAEANMHDGAGKVRALMKEMGVEKTPGCSSIEVNGMVFEFIVRDKSHPQQEETYACLMQLARQMEHDRSMPNISQIDFT